MNRILLIHLCALNFCLGAYSVAFAADSLIQIEQGWDSKDLEKAYSGNLGAEIVPLNWFQSLERGDSNLMFSENLERFGFIARQGQLPIGITIDENAITGKLYNENKWIGVNCAACHTSALEINHRKIVINGNQSLLRIQEFEESLISSVRSTIQDQSKFLRFVEQIKATDSEALLKNLKLFEKEFGSSNQRNHHFFDDNGKEVRFGPGRIDGLGGATNTLTCHLDERLGQAPNLQSIFVNPENCKTSHAPSSVPHLWNMVNQEYTQWNAEVHASLGRNVGAMMAGFGKTWIDKTFIGVPKVVTSIRVDEVANFEHLYKKLNSPKWDDLVKLKVVEPLEIQRISRGKAIYAQNCISCHATQPQTTPVNQHGNSYWMSPVFSVGEIGTDDNYIKNEFTRRVKINSATVNYYKAAFGTEIVDSSNTVPAFAGRGFIVGAALDNYFKENNLSADQILKLNNCRTDKNYQPKQGIKSESLEGIVFTAPFLHNGSVPSLMDLLSKAEKRPKTFYLGCAQYDVRNLGFECKESDENIFQFNTELQGNGNSGHEYGTELTEEEKLDLLEFLKSIEQPEAPQTNPNCS